MGVLSTFWAIIEIYIAILKSIGQLFIPYDWKEKDVSQDTVVITGGGSGIGRLLAQKFAMRGSKVIIIDIDEAGMDKTCQLVERIGGTCKAYKCDISNREYVYTTAEKIKEDVGFVSIVINNAGITGSARRVSDLNDDRTVMTMNVNVMSHFWMTKAFLPDMLKENRGHLVYIASYAGLAGSVALADYAASKFAVMGFSESLALELSTDGYDNIHVTTVCPWLIDTGLFSGARNPYIPALEPKYAAQRIIQGILANEILIYLPRILYVLVFLKAVLPCEAANKLYALLEGYTFMDGFTGRQHKIQDGSLDDNQNDIPQEPINNLNHKPRRKSSKKGNKKPVININGSTLENTNSFSNED